MTVTMLIGLPGSGKSTYAQKLAKRITIEGTEIVSSDEIRKEIFGDINDQTHNEEVFTILKERVVDILDNKNKNVVIDATNITRKNRISIINYIDSKISWFYEYNSIEYVIIATPYYQCILNNEKREKVVPKEVIQRMFKQFEFPTPNEVINYHDGAISIVYPFKLDKEVYVEKEPYRKFMNIPHDNPHHRHSIGSHMHHAYRIMKDIVGEDNKVLLAAAALHDIGKFYCKTYDNNGIAHYYNHENVGCYEAMFYGKNMKFFQSEIIELCSLICYHMRIKQAKTPKAREKLLDTVGSKLFFKLKLLNIVDEEAQ